MKQETEAYNLPITTEDADFLYDVLAYAEIHDPAISPKVEEMIERIRATGCGI